MSTAAPPDIRAIARHVARQAQAGEEIEAYVGRSSAIEVKAYGGEVESLEDARSQGIGIRVVGDARQGFAWAASLDDEVIAETLADARDNRTFAEPDDAVALIEPDGVEPPELNTWSDDVESFSTESKIAMAIDLEKATLAGDPRVKGVRTAMYGDSSGEAALVSSRGIDVWSRSTSTWLSVSALASEGDETQIGGGVDVGRSPHELDIAVASADAVERATRMLGATKPKSQRITVVFDPRVAASFWGIIASMFTGSSVLKGRSPFGDRLGDPIAAPAVTLTDDPTDATSMRAGRYDGEGLGCRRTPLIASGVLTNFLHNGYTARRLASTSTASASRGYRSTPGVAPRALALAPGELDRDAIYKSVGDGVLIQSVTGLHSGVNSVSGDFSVGAEGLMIRNGEVAEPVREMTIASNLQRMLLDISLIGGDVEVLPSGAKSVSVAIGNVSLSGS